MTGGINKGSRWAALAVTIATAVFGFAGTATAGSFHSESACPNGVPAARLVIDMGEVAPGVTRTTINGADVDPEVGLTVTTGGTYNAVWYGPARDANGNLVPGTEVVWGTKSITVTVNSDACVQVAAPPTTPVEATTSTMVPGVNLPCPLPIFTGNGWVCPPVPSTTSVAIGLQVSACDQVPADCAVTSVAPPVVTGQLPATGRNIDLLLTVGSLTAAAGVSLLIVRRRTPVAS